MTHPSPTDAALQIAQQAVTILAKWAKVDLPPECICLPDYPVVDRVKQEILPWPSGDQPQPLRVLFDEVKLDKGQTVKHYWPAIAIADSDPTINYPQEQEPNLEKLQGEVKNALNTISGGDWQNLSLLTLIIEKFGSYISFGEKDVAFVDLVRSTAAIAAAIVQNPASNEIGLIAGDLSGIQKFIYTISSDGALKSLRARSFYLELVTEEVVQQLLEALDLPRTNIIYAGGGNLYLLTSNEANKAKPNFSTVCDRFNKWLKDTFQGKLFLALDYLSVPTTALKTKEFAENYWTNLTKNLAKQKLRKFENEIADFIKPTRTYEPCRVCYRDDLPSLKPLNRFEANSSRACWMCRTMFDLGDELFDVKAIVRSNRSQIKGAVDRIYLPTTYYYFFKEVEQALAAARNEEKVFIINNWSLNHYKSNNNSIVLLLGNYGKESEKIESQRNPGFMPAGEMVEKAQGIPRLGYLRMDVDRLGQIFAKGLGEKQTLPRLAGLSRLMSYFFKVYLNSLAENRLPNLPENRKILTDNLRQNLLFIYAGGDDLFVSGAWNEVVEFAFDVYQSFRAYTGKNPDITLSAGISISAPKFPLYQAAEESGEAEKAAKNNGRDSLGLFGEKFKWDQWLGVKDINVIDDKIQDYLKLENRPDLWGIFPFVEQLNKQLDINYSRSFVRNLLLTAELQEQMLKKFKEKSEEELRNFLLTPQLQEQTPEEFKEKLKKQQIEIHYYLHLPKIAYTLARLPSHVLDSKDFALVRISLKSPYNAPYFRAIATWIELLNRS